MVVWRIFVLIKGSLFCTKIRTIMLMQARGLRFTKIDNNFAFFALSQTGKTSIPRPGLLVESPTGVICPEMQ
jgi:hypothetical protein